jgi:hypothetical protein
MQMHDNYPGVEFTPPEGTVAMGQDEGEAMVKWIKIGERFTITHIDGKPLERGVQPNEKVISNDDEDVPVQHSADKEIDAMAADY